LYILREFHGSKMPSLSMLSHYNNIWVSYTYLNHLLPAALKPFNY
jgi:uncharacterized membrane protein